MDTQGTATARRLIGISLAVAAVLAGTAGCGQHGTARAERSPAVLRPSDPPASVRPVTAAPPTAPPTSPTGPSAAQLRDYLSVVRSSVPGLAKQSDSALEAEGEAICADLRSGTGVFSTVQDVSGPRLTVEQGAGMVAVVAGPYGGLCTDQAQKVQAWLEAPDSGPAV